MLTASAASAAPPGGPPLPTAAQQMWNNTFGRVFGELPMGPDYPGEGVQAPGDCTREALDEMEIEKDKLCEKDMKCKGNECNMSVLQQRVADRNACIEARVNIMLTCFRGGNEKHWFEVKNHLNGLVTCQGCMAKLSAGQCNKQEES